MRHTVHEWLGAHQHGEGMAKKKSGGKKLPVPFSEANEASAAGKSLGATRVKKKKAAGKKRAGKRKPK